jgi:hypothetical protein
MSEPAVISIPLSSVDNMKMEEAWRFTELFDQYWSIREDLEILKHRLQFDDFSEPNSLPLFDPYRIIHQNILQSRLL